MANEFALALIPLEQIDESPFQPRTEFEEAAVKALAESMRAAGLITPIVLRRQPGPGTSEAGSRYQLVCGERRVRAAKLLGWTEIRGIVEEMSEVEAAVRVVVDNEARADINIMDKARSYQKLLGPPANLSQLELSKRLGQADSTYVSRILALLDQPEAIQTMIARGLLTEHHVRILNRISDVKERTAIARKAAAQKWSREKLGELVKGRARPRAKGGAESGSKAAPVSSEIYDFRFRLEGQEISVLACPKFRVGYDLPEQYALRLKTDLVSFLRYEVPAFQGGTAEGASQDVATESASGSELPPEGAATEGLSTTPTALRISQPRAGEPTAPGTTASAQPAAPGSEAVAPATEDLAAELQKSLGPAGEVLSNLARAFENPGESGSSFDLGKMFKLFKGPKK